MYRIDGGCAALVALFLGKRLYVANAGDCRYYEHVLAAKLRCIVILFITHNMRILFPKAHLYKSIRFIFTCGKGLYSQSEWRTAISHVEV